MGDVIRLVSGDTKPNIEVTISDESDSSVYDLSAETTSVSVFFKAAGSTATPTEIACTKVTDGSDGKVEFDFSGDVLDGLAAGAYEGEIVVDLGSGSTHTVYEKLRFRLRT